MVHLSQEYSPDHPRFRGHYRVTLLMAGIPLFSALLMVMTLPDHEPWMLATAGISLGLIGILWGVTALHPFDPRLLPPVRHLVKLRAQWYPLFFVALQGVIFLITALFWWFTITRMLFEVSAYYSVSVIILVTLYPFQRYYAAKRISDPLLPVGRTEELLRFVFFIVSVVLVTNLIHQAMLEEDPGTMPKDKNFVAIILWVPALILLAFRLVLLLYRVTPQRRPASEPARTDGFTT